MPTSAPSETDFLATFGVEPVESAPVDGYWAYIFDGPGDSRVQFSFNTHEGSVQTALFVGETQVVTVVVEEAESILIHGDDTISVAFTSPTSLALRIRIFPTACVEWSSIRP